MSMLPPDEILDHFDKLASLGQVRTVFCSNASCADTYKDDIDGPIEEDEFQPIKILEEQLGDHEDEEYEDDEDDENDELLQLELMPPVDDDYEEHYDPKTGEVTVVARQGKRLTDDEIIEAVEKSEAHAKVSAHFDRVLLGITLYYLRNARDAYETPGDKLDEEEDYIEIEDDSDTSASYAIILGPGEMSLDEIKEEIPKVESYFGIDYYPYGDPYLSKFNGERKLAAGEKEKIYDRYLSALRLIENATIEELRELYRDFSVNDKSSNITPAKRSNEEPQAPKEAKRPRRIQPEQVESSNPEMAK
ncbi:hypothetical protein KCU65_g10031, partial [Aureobasidium melanogenum]